RFPANRSLREAGRASGRARSGTCAPAGVFREEISVVCGTPERARQRCGERTFAVFALRPHFGTRNFCGAGEAGKVETGKSGRKRKRQTGGLVEYGPGGGELSG